MLGNDNIEDFWRHLCPEREIYLVQDVAKKMSPQSGGICVVFMTPINSTTHAIF